MAQYSDLDPTRLKASLSDGTDLKPSITTSGYAGGTPAAVTDLKPSICYANGTLKQSIADATDLKPGLLIAGAARGGYLGAGIQDNNIVKHIRGENGNGNAPVDDGYYLDTATATGGLKVTTIHQKFGTGSLDFDGIDDVLTFSGTTALESTSSDCTTWECWFRPETLSSNRGLWSMVNGTNYIHAYLDGSGSVAVTALLGTPRFGIISPPGTVTANTWHFFRLVRNNTEFELFVDGVSFGTQADSNQWGGVGWDLNVGDGYSTDNFDGQIDEFLILDQICLGRGKPTAALAPVATYSYQSTNDMAAWYKFEEGSSTVVGDSSGNGNDGTANGGMTWVTGKIGSYAGDFDGSDDYVTASAVSSLTTYTLSLWFNADTTSPAYQNILSYEVNTPVIRLAGSTLEFYSDNTAPQAIVTSSSISTGTWYHVAVAFDDGAAELFVNGSSVGTDSDTSHSGWGTGTTYMGRYKTGIEYFDGSIDDVRIYDRALSAAEVLALYNENA